MLLREEGKLPTLLKWLYIITVNIGDMTHFFKRSYNSHQEKG
jgi:hypothetical protein